MSIYVLVASNLSTEAWNRLTGRNDYPYEGYLGGKVWNQVIPILEAKGKLSNQIEKLSQLILRHDLKNIILVGASYCGMMITGVTNRMPDRIDLLNYLDTVLPVSGQSVIDIFKLAHLNPKMPIENPPTYTEKLCFDSQKIHSIRRLYVLCTESNFTSVTSLAKHQIASDRKN